MKIYLVGGAVRDMLMGCVPSDRDYVVVGSTPAEMISLGFTQVGAAFPVFLHPDSNEEYALARTEVKTASGHAGFNCVFDPTVTLEQDLFRRDITINAIAYDLETKQFIDPYGGQDDIKSKTLRHVSDAFAEDPLRVIRLARFYSRFVGFTVHPKTVDLACEISKSGELNTLSTERFWEEMRKVFSSETSDPGLFFTALRNLSVFGNSDFFTTVFGDVNWDDFDKIKKVGCDSIRVAVHDSEFAMCMFVAIIQNHTAWRKDYFTNRGLQTIHNYHKAIHINENSSDELYDVLSKTRSTNNVSVAFTDLLKTLAVSGHNVLRKQLITAQNAAMEINSDNFVHLTGKEIGVAIKTVKIEAIRVAIYKCII